jgi:vancomycin resistance protein VanJ
MSQDVVPTPVIVSSTSKSASRGRMALALCVWAYLAAMLLLWFVLMKADEWWFATFLMFSPRWVFALPLTVLLPAALLLRSKWTSLALLAAGLVVGGPVTGFNVPWRRLFTFAPAGQPFRVMTVNLHYDRFGNQPLEDLIAAEQPDMVAIQEWSGADQSSFHNDPNWHISMVPHLFFASRHPIRRVVELGRDSMSARAAVCRYEIETPLGLVHVFNLHTASPRPGIRKGPNEVQANSDRRREQLEFIAKEAAHCDCPVLVVGDFNTPPDSQYFLKFWSEYTDAFAAAGWGWGYSFDGGRTNVRIDHILIGQGWYCTNCRVGPAVNSPHRPVIADLVWSASRRRVEP